MKCPTQKPLFFRNTGRLRIHYPTLAKAMLWYNKLQNEGKPIAAHHTIFTRGRGCYPAISIHGEKIMIHVLMMMYRLKGNVPEDFVVHHADENIWNCTQINIELMGHRSHARLHNLGRDCARWRGKCLRYAEGVQPPMNLPDAEVTKTPVSDLPF